MGRALGLWELYKELWGHGNHRAKTTIATFVAKVAIASSKTQRASWHQRTSRHNTTTDARLAPSKATTSAGTMSHLAANRRSTSARSLADMTSRLVAPTG